MKKRVWLIWALLLLLVLTACAPKEEWAVTEGPTLNGRPIGNYTIVYPENASDYCLRAAEYLQTQIAERTGYTLTLCTDTSGTYPFEILVGETNRELSGKLTYARQTMEFATLANKTHIALEGDFFLIGAAAYYFVQTYIPGRSFDTAVPQELCINMPITEAPTHYMLLIGDGMGEVHTQLLPLIDLKMQGLAEQVDGQFYGYYLPYTGYVSTGSFTGITDSAASATALATGYKTYNKYIGKDSDLNDRPSLTELANSLGMATAVMSTEGITGATPAAFSAHVEERSDRTAIAASQEAVQAEGTLLMGSLENQEDIPNALRQALTQLDSCEKGFFLMYEEAYIDKYCSAEDMNGVYFSMLRFQQAIGVFMEYACYHPDTLVIITADHETGGLSIGAQGPELSTTGHTNTQVRLFAYGQGAEAFDNFNAHNIEIPKIIAGCWGVTDFGAPLPAQFQ